MLRRVWKATAVCAVIAAFAVPAALADSCANFSRPAPACNMGCTTVVTVGNWVWLPSIGAPIAAWGFAPPGGPDSVFAGLPGQNGNYTNGQTQSLLGMSALCTGTSGAIFKRQDGVLFLNDPGLFRGVWSGCE
jgi:hypothetical protein